MSHAHEDRLYRIMPTRLMSGRSVREMPVVRIVATPPAMRRSGDAPIVADLTLVDVTLADGSHRHFGFQHAWIGSDLHMHVGPVNPRDEVRFNWTVSEPPTAPHPMAPPEPWQKILVP